MRVFTLDNYIEKKLKDPHFRGEYDRELIINGIARMIIELRNSAKLTQLQLAKKIGTSQSVIARLESGSDLRMPSIDLLARIANASHAVLNISFTQQQ